MLSTVGCASYEIRQQARSGEFRKTERKLAALEKEARNRPQPVPAAKKPDLPPRWRPVQAHVSGGPVFRRNDATAARGTLSLARIWSRPSEKQPGALSGPFGGVGLEGTVERNGITVGPLLRAGAAAGEYLYPGTNSPDLYGYGQFVPFVGVREGRFVSGLRLGGGLTAPGPLRGLLARNHQTAYADHPGSPVDLGVGRGVLEGVGRLVLVPLALVNHVDGSVEATSQGDLGAGVAVGSDPSELIAPLR